MNFLFLIILEMVLFKRLVFGQWISFGSYISTDQLFSFNNNSTAYVSSGNFIEMGTTNTTANFITCIQPSTSYITLNANHPQAVHYQSSYQYFQKDIYISFDLFFQGTWTGQTVTYSVAQCSYSFSYISPQNYPLQTQFCDNEFADVKTVNFTIPNTQICTGNQILKSSNTGDGQVSIRNLKITSASCHKICQTCSGPQYNQCKSCNYGTLVNGQCSYCPKATPYFSPSKRQCYAICPYQYLKINDVYCEAFSSSYFLYGYFTATSTENTFWTVVQDPNHLDNTPSVIPYNGYSFGVVKYSQGLSRIVTTLKPSYTILGNLFQIQIILFNPMPINSGIQFKINNTYYASIYMNGSGLQFHKILLFDVSTINSCYLTYTSCYLYQLYLFVDIPQYKFEFTVIGNYGDSNSGWGLQQFFVTSGYCPATCSLCELSFQCKQCQTNYILVSDGTCISINNCIQPYQQLINSICQNYDQETTYSKYLIQEYLGNDGDPTQYSKYKLISQSGVNFLKGIDIYFSFWQDIRVFGGPFVWAQAKFSRTFNNIEPHFSITIGFYILIGPTFPPDSSFIYQIENNAPVTNPQSSITNYSIYGNTTRIIERITHSTSTLTIQWECFGSNNEPINSYCGFYNFYVAVHYCQPYCSQCIDSKTCLQWNSTYDSSIVKISESDCLSNEYYYKFNLSCQPCPYSCLTCVSKLDCLTCKSTYILTKLGCVCKMNQYEDNQQCLECPIECNQCLTTTHCLECLSTNFRKLSNEQCNCIDGYYPIAGIAKCSKCDKFCFQCTGPTNSECIMCSNIPNIESIGTTCQCPSNTYFDSNQSSCVFCHSSCKTCSSNTYSACVTCDQSIFRIQNGSQCQCQSGYYESSNVCTICPTTEDSSLSSCYKDCNNNKIWFYSTCITCSTECNQCDFNTITCQNCKNIGFIPLQNYCQNICGDKLVVIDPEGIYTEDCDDGNTDDFDGCNNQCKYECQPITICTSCVSNQCQQCAFGYHLNQQENKCESVCGDGILAPTESCEISFNLPYKCINCQIVKQSYCQTYITSIGCILCIDGYQLIDHFCYSQCGNYIVTMDEECDDGNLFPFDGCYNCQFQCSMLCAYCLYGNCLECIEGYQLYDQNCQQIQELKSKFSTNSYCGDGIIDYDEECDDMNHIQYDGCFNCKLDCIKFCQECVKGACLDCQNNNRQVNNFCQLQFIDFCWLYISHYCVKCKEGFQLNYNFNQCEPISLGQVIYNNFLQEENQLVVSLKIQEIQKQILCDSSCSHQLNFNFLPHDIGWDIVDNGENQLSICGDQVVLGTEQCDDGNTIVNDGCYQCKYQCPDNCKKCLQGICQECKNGFKINLIARQCEEEMLNRQDEIVVEDLLSLTEFAQKQYTNCQQNCIQCEYGNCLQCRLGYYGNECIPICGDGIRVSSEDCDDQNTIEFDGCFNCKYSCPNNCLKCFQGKCLFCQLKYYLFDNFCYPILYNIGNFVPIQSQCGNKIVEQNEVCDDSNNFEFDGCFQCQFSCDLYCQNCQFGICLECFPEYQLTQQHNCESICGNGKIELYSNEQCDDSNNIQFDGCYNCYWECKQNCLFCNELQCFKCKEGYVTNGQFCNPFCGDGIVINGLEECDDGNNNQGDGCYNCKFTCQNGCIECSDGVCLRQCADGYQLIKNVCTSICGDNLVVETEDCDDGNSIEFDGCFNCLYSCPSYCDECEQGICIKCETGLLLINQQCQFFIENQDSDIIVYDCGNGIKNTQEECDDGNLQPLDGCYQCAIEENWVCNQLGSCEFFKSPQIFLTFLNQTGSKQFVRYEITQQINLKKSQTISSQSYFYIQDLEQNNYEIQISNLDNILNQVLKVQIFQEMDVKPKLILQLNEDICNNYGQCVENTNNFIYLNIPFFIEPNILQQAQSLSYANKYILIIILVIGGISLLLGDSEIFFETLSALQFQSFIKYINLNYPENLVIYFESSNVISIQPLVDIFNLDSFVELITFEGQTAQGKGKFSYYQEETDLFNNLLAQFIQLFLLLITLLSEEIITKVMISLLTNKWYVHFLHFLNQKLGFKVMNKVQLGIISIPKFFLKIKSNLNFKGLRSILIVNSWDILFKSFLYLSAISSFNSTRIVLSTFLSLSIIFTYIQAIYEGFSTTTIKQQRLIECFESFELTRTLFFSMALALFQESQIQQLSIITMSNIFQLLILIKKRKLFSLLEFSAKSSIELSVSVAMLTSLLYLDDFSLFVSNTIKVKIAQFQMFFLLQGVCFVLVKMLFQRVSEIIKSCSKYKIKENKAALFF